MCGIDRSKNEKRCKNGAETVSFPGKHEHARLHRRGATRTLQLRASAVNPDATQRIVSPFVSMDVHSWLPPAHTKNRGQIRPATAKSGQPGPTLKIQRCPVSIITFDTQRGWSVLSAQAPRGTVRSPSVLQPRLCCESIVFRWADENLSRSAKLAKHMVAFLPGQLDRSPPGTPSRAGT